MEQNNLPPLFFSSIPKCGKNIVYSFLFELGYKPSELNDGGLYYAVNCRESRSMDERDHYLVAHRELTPDETQFGKRALEEKMASLRTGEVLHRHFYYTEHLSSVLSQSNIKTIFVYRDPRDCLLSAVNYVFDQHKPEHIYKRLQSLTREQAALSMLKGDSRLIPFAEWFDGYYSWLDAPNVIALRFEDIIGAKGGGSDVAQKIAFSKLVNELGILVPPELFERALSCAFNASAGTFRKGQIGSWVHESTWGIRRTFHASCKSLPAKWGYRRRNSSDGRLSEDAIASIINGLIRAKADRLVLEQANRNLRTQLKSMEEKAAEYQTLEAQLVKARRHFSECTKERDALQEQLRRMESGT